MAIDAGQVNRIVWRGCARPQLVRRPIFLGPVVADPSPGPRIHSPGRALVQTTADPSNDVFETARSLLIDILERGAESHDVRVGIMKPGNDGRAPHVEDARGQSFEPEDIGVRCRRGDPVNRKSRRLLRPEFRESTV